MIKLEKLPPDIRNRIPAAVAVLERDERVLFAYLFGGLVRGEQKPLSDVDIAVFLTGTDGLAEYKLDLFDRLTDALGTSELDLVVLNNAPVSIAGRVLQNKKTLVDKDPFRRHSYEAVTLREFGASSTTSSTPPPRRRCASSRCRSTSRGSTGGAG